MRSGGLLGALTPQHIGGQGEASNSSRPLPQMLPRAVCQRASEAKPLILRCRVRDLNSRPTVYKTHAPINKINALVSRVAYVLHPRSCHDVNDRFQFLDNLVCRLL